MVIDVTLTVVICKEKCFHSSLLSSTAQLVSQFGHEIDYPRKLKPFLKDVSKKKLGIHYWEEGLKGIS